MPTTSRRGPLRRVGGPLLAATLLLWGAAPTLESATPSAPGSAPESVPATARAPLDLLGAETKRMADGRELVAVALTVAHGRRDALDAAVRALGGRPIPRDGLDAGRLLEAWVPPDRAAALAAFPGVDRLDPIRRPAVGGVTPRIATSGAARRALTSTVPLAAGADLIGASAWHAAGYTGAGIRIGIIDGGFTGLADLPEAAFPGGIRYRCYPEIGISSSLPSACEQGSTPHGTSVAETVAAAAPGATLFVANPISTLDMRETVEWMTANGVRIVNASFNSADVYDGPGDGTSPTDDSYYPLIDRAVAGGALWVNAAGNSGDTGWSGAWSDPDGDDWLDWQPGGEGNGFTLAPASQVRVALRWSDPWGRSANDYDLFLYAEGRSTPVASSTDAQRGRGDPVERLGYRATIGGRFELRVRHRAGGTAERLEVLAESSSILGGLDVAVSRGTLPSPADAASAGMIAVGAVDVRTPDELESYSSQGPTIDGRTRPDVVAPDCATTSNGPFCGTSQAAPFAAGAAALLLQANPGLGPAALADALRARTAALPGRGALPDGGSGFGRVSLGQPPAGPPPAPPDVPSPSLPPRGTVGISGAGTATAWRALAAGSPSVIHTAVVDEGSGMPVVAYRRSLDGGASFERRIELSGPVAGGGGGAVEGAAVAASGSVVAVAWLEGDVEGIGPAVVRLRASPDDGATWGIAQEVSPLDGRAGPPAVGVSGNRVVVAWTDRETGAISIAVSENGGIAFGPPIGVGRTTSLPSDAEGLLDGYPAVGIEGTTIHLAWTSSASRISYRRSSDAGASWGRTAPIDGSAARDDRAWLAVAGRSVVVGYAARASTRGPALAFVRRSADGGATWAARSLVAASSTTSSRRVVATTAGSVIRVAWATCASATCARTRTWYRQSANGGRTWSRPVALSAATLDSEPVGIVVTRRILVAYGLDRSPGAEGTTLTLRIR